MSNLIKYQTDKNGKILSIRGKYDENIDIEYIDKNLKQYIEPEDKKNKYICDTSVLILEYKKFGPYKRVVTFGPQPVINNEKENELELLKREKRIQVISRYIFIAENYVDIDVIYQTNQSKSCPQCKEDSTEQNEAGFNNCTNCGYEKIIFNVCDNYEIHRNTYKDEDNFRKTLDRYQGKLEPDHNIMKIIISELDYYFKSYGMVTGEEIRKLEVDSRGKKKGTSYHMMYEALLGIGKPIYEHTNIICSKYWGWDLPDITHLEEQIISDYKATQRVLVRLNKTRKSSINTQYRLFKHLQLVEYPCSLSDFRVVKTRDSQEQHEILWEKMVTGCDLKYIPTI